ncbi:MAG: hypothetical protein V3T05_08225, partial [Myxococcota bacterium]
MLTTTRSSFAAGILVLAACNGDDARVVAHVRAVSGDVTVKATEHAEAEPATADRTLNQGNVVTTGDASTATVEFKGGNRVDLDPNTVLVIRKAGGTTAQFGAIMVDLLEGSAKASSSGQGVILAIGMPFGLTELGAAESSLELSFTEGLRVLVGEVTVLTDDGQRHSVLAGKAFSVEGLTLEVGAKKEELLILEAMQFVLLANPKQVQVKRKGENKWRAPKKREVLESGDAVRTRRGTNTRVQFGDYGFARLARGTEVSFDDVRSSTNAHRAAYRLTIGNIIVHLEQDGGVSSKHEIEVAGLTVGIV